jgi:hypothetical protein
VDVATRKVLLKTGPPSQQPLAGDYYKVYLTKGGQPALIQVADGRLLVPKPKMPSAGGKLASSYEIMMTRDGRQVWVMAEGKDRRGHYGLWRQPGQAPEVALSRKLPIMPNASWYNPGTKTVEVFYARPLFQLPGTQVRPAAKGECARHRLRPGKEALCRVSDPDRLPVAYWLSGEWVSFNVSGDQWGQMMGVPHVLNTATGRKPISLVPAVCSGGSPGSITALRDPPRVLSGCLLSDGTRVHYLWSPGKLQVLKQKGLPSPVLTGTLTEPVLVLQRGEKPVTWWLDMGRGVAIRTPPVFPSPGHWEQRRRAIGFRRAGRRWELVLLDLERYVAEVIAVYRDCAKGKIWVGDEEGDLITVTCKLQPDPHTWVFIPRWSEVLDLRRRKRWRTRHLVERILPGGKVIVSNRRSTAAESHTAGTWVGMLELD